MKQNVCITGIINNHVVINKKCTCACQALICHLESLHAFSACTSTPGAIESGIRKSHYTILESVTYKFSLHVVPVM